MLISDQLWISGGVSATLADGKSIVMPDSTQADSLDTDQVRSSIIKYNRMQISAGAEYNLSLQHQFRFSIFKVINTDDGIVEYWDWVTPQWKRRSEKNKDDANFVNQDDIIARLTYSYTF